MCKGKIFASMLLYPSFPLIRLATCPYYEKVDFISAKETLCMGTLFEIKLGRGPLGDTTYQISNSRPCGFR